MRQNLPKTSIIRDRETLLDLATDGTKEILNLIPASENIVYVNWHAAAGSETVLDNTNVVIAAYTTARARLKLYSYIEQLDRRVFYCDTDSVIYLSQGIPNEYNPPLGNFLGEMTDEVECYGVGSYIETFVSGGPKFYSYRIRSPDGKHHDVCKIKGITLNYSTTEKLNFEKIRDLVLNDEIEKITFSRILRTPLHGVIMKNDQTKICKSNHKKYRHLDLDYSVPYGYVEE